MLEAELGHKVAETLSEATGRIVKYFAYDEPLMRFSVERMRAGKCIDIGGGVTQEPHIYDISKDGWKPNSHRIYREITCYPHQCIDGDLEFFILNDMSQNQHPVFADSPDIKTVLKDFEKQGLTRSRSRAQTQQKIASLIETCFPS